MKENLRRIGTWARRQGEHFDLYLHALPQRTRLTLIFAILALLSVTLLFICGSIYRIGRNDGFNARRIQCTADSMHGGSIRHGNSPPLPRNGAAIRRTSV